MFDRYDIFRKIDESKYFVDYDIKRIVDERGINDEQKKEVSDFIRQGLLILDKIGNKSYYLKGGCLIAYEENTDSGSICSPNYERFTRIMINIFTERGKEIPKVVRELESLMDVDAVKLENVKYVDF